MRIVSELRKNISTCRLLLRRQGQSPVSIGFVLLLKAYNVAIEDVYHATHSGGVRCVLGCRLVVYRRTKKNTDHENAVDYLATWRSQGGLLRCFRLSATGLGLSRASRNSNILRVLQLYFNMIKNMLKEHQVLFSRFSGIPGKSYKTFDESDSRKPHKIRGDFRP